MDVNDRKGSEMRSSKTGTVTRVAPIHALFGAAVLGLLVMPLALAGASPRAATSGSTKRQIKALSRRVAALENKAAPATPALPTTLPPSGPASGVLTGIYPSPSGLAPDSVSSAQILDHSIDQVDFGGGIVGADQLKSTYERVSQGVAVARGRFGTATSSCDAGDKVLGGGYAWETPPIDSSTALSTPNVSGGGFDNPDQWVVEAESGIDNVLFAWAVCERA
jgi:hypothetical protein